MLFEKFNMLFVLNVKCIHTYYCGLWRAGWKPFLNTWKLLYWNYVVVDKMAGKASPVGFFFISFLYIPIQYRGNNCCSYSHEQCLLAGWQFNETFWILPKAFSPVGNPVRFTSVHLLKSSRVILDATLFVGFWPPLLWLFN